MCQIIVRSKNYTHPDPIIDRIIHYKRGMPVAVVEDDHEWGRLESKKVWIDEGRNPAEWPGTHVIIKLPGIPVKKVQSLLEQQFEDDSGKKTDDIFRQRRWRVDLDNLPPGIKKSLEQHGEVSTGSVQIRQQLRRISDNARFTGLD